MAIPIKYILQGDVGTNQPVNIRADSSSNTMQTISYPHHEIHAGSHFFAYRTASLGNGYIATLGITTTSTSKEMHMFMEFDVATACSIDVLEDCDAFAGGVAFTPLNNWREKQGIKNSTASILTGATGDNPITVGSGNEIYAQELGSGNRAGGTLAHDAEMILKKNSKYLFRITNGITSQGVTIILQWYEHNNRTDT